MDEPDWQCRLSPIEEIFFATSPSAKILRPDERQPFKERWLGRYIAHDIESFFVAITEVSTVAGYLAGCLDNPVHNPRFADIGYYASFAEKNEFRPLATAHWNRADVVFMGRLLRPPLTQRHLDRERT
jgi:hypothetical protein